MLQLKHLLKLYWSKEAREDTNVLLYATLHENKDEIMADCKRSFENGIQENEISLNESISHNILKVIHKKIETEKFGSLKPRVKVFRLPVRAIGWAAAVAIYVFSVIGIYKHFTASTNTTFIAAASGIKHPIVKTVENNNTKTLNFILPDHSTVVLYPGSSLSYEEDFQPTYRSLTLKGKALFTVAKDSLRPFTVYANGVATTALGTEFSVNTLLNVNSVNVRLIKGKVVIRSVYNDNRVNDIYLNAGQECTFDISHHKTIVNYFKEKINPINSTGKTKETNKVPDELNFSKEPLTSIFRKISKKFNVNIKYNDAELKNLSFTGQFLPSDSLPMIMSVVCSTNDLSYSRAGELITVRK